MNLRLLKIVLSGVIAVSLFASALGLFAQASTAARRSNLYDFFATKNVQLTVNDRERIDAWFRSIRNINQWICVATAVQGLICAIIIIRLPKNDNKK